MQGSAMKGIILAGGSGTRLYPLTQVVSKQLLPVYDKPMIYYPLSLLMEANIREVLLISTPRDLPVYQALLGDGSRFGLEISYVEQPRPEGLAQAFILGSSFIGNDPVCLALGDNVFYGKSMASLLVEASQLTEGGLVFGVNVPNPSQFGVVEFDESGKVRSLEEKPTAPKSSFAVPGLYFYDHQVTDIVKNIRPSARGELEITDVNQVYLDQGQLRVKILPEENYWLDTGTHCSLHSATNYVQAETKKGRLVACLEEIAYRKGYISLDELQALVQPMGKSDYAVSLLKVIQDEKAIAK